MSRQQIIIQLLKAYRSMGANYFQVALEFFKLQFATNEWLLREAYMILNREI